MACMSGGGEVALTESMLTALFWTRSDAGEDGLVYFNPGVGEDTAVYMAEDGSFCHVESLTVGSAPASEILIAALGSEEGAAFDTSKDAMGCTRLDFTTGVSATITSGGNDPTCASDTDSGVRFEAVSYTHLDVYKRQDVDFPELSLQRRNRASTAPVIANLHL